MERMGRGAPSRRRFEDTRAGPDVGVELGGPWSSQPAASHPASRASEAGEQRRTGERIIVETPTTGGRSWAESVMAFAGRRVWKGTAIDPATENLQDSSPREPLRR
jgi:hypothetical protein